MGWVVPIGMRWPIQVAIILAVNTVHSGSCSPACLPVHLQQSPPLLLAKHEKILWGLGGGNHPWGSALRLRGGHPSRKKLAQQMKLEADAAAAAAVGKKNKTKAVVGMNIEGVGKPSVLAKDVLKSLKKSRKKSKRETLSKKKREKAPFRPWVDQAEEGETLVPALEAYDCLFPMNAEWPALSFDFMEDPSGPKRGFPISTTIVSGTQATTPEGNKVVVMEIFGLRRFRKRRRDDDSVEDEEGEGMESSSDDFEQYVKGIKVEPKVHHYSVPHQGTVNRVRCQPQRPTHVATWSETGKVHLYDMSSPIDSKLLRTLECHDCEGFALGWSRVCSGMLASGDVRGNVYVHNVNESARDVPARLLAGHTASVEDLCWSPAEPNVLATCSADRSIRFWDLEQVEGKECALVIENAHECDVNAISWNCMEQHLLVSGGDDGSIRVWDLGSLRKLGKQVVGSALQHPVAVYRFHRQAINTLDWHPTDSCLFLASCRDDSVSVWDVSVERDEGAQDLETKYGLEDLPPQLLFTHHGQKELMEARWHPVIPTVVFSAAADGFNIWRASTL